MNLQIQGSKSINSNSKYHIQKFIINNFLKNTATLKIIIVTSPHLTFIYFGFPLSLSTLKNRERIILRIDRKIDSLSIHDNPDANS